MKHLCILLLLFFLSATVSAQSNYQPGYVINFKNDTLKGFIDYKGWGNNPETIYFKSTLNETKPQNISTDNAKGFAIIGVEDYEKFIFIRSNSVTDINRLQVGIDTTHTLDTAFLKRISTGKNVTLFSFTDKNKTRFYTKSNIDSQPQELDFYIYYPMVNNTTAETMYTFRMQLKEIASTYDVTDPKLAVKIKNAYYRENDIKAIVDLINGKSNRTYKKSDLPGTRYFIGAAASFGKLETGGGPTFFPDGTNANSKSAAFTGGFDIILNKYTRRFIFRTELELSNGHYSIPATSLNNLGTFASFDFKQYTAAIVPQFIFNAYSANNFKIFIDAGVSINISSYNKYTYTVNFVNGSVDKKPNYPDFEKFWAAVSVKAGFLVIKHIELYVSHGFPSSITQSNTATARIGYLQTGVNYLF